MPPPNSRSDGPHADVVLIKRNPPTSSTPHETIHIGPLRLEILEDGRNTDRRIATIRIHVPPHTPGPQQHWHQMHDETFLVEKGVATFTSRTDKIVAQEGDYVVVPTCAPHTFANEGEEECVLVNTFTPAFYVDYFRVMAAMVEENGGEMTREIGKVAMERYATLQTGVAKEW